ncbi:MAG: hypothetical protein C5S52_03335 [ANME-2 cluster archaeon]|nr:hypothetical protein [ANME-2 cluster archaeon]
MKTTVVFVMALLAIVAMSGCIDDDTNDVWNVTDVDASNDTSTTLVKVDEGLSDKEVEELINETESEPEVTPEPALLVEVDDVDPTFEMNETVNQSGLSITIEPIKNRRFGTVPYREAARIGTKELKFYVTIAAIGNDTIETGLGHFQIMDELGRTYRSVPHDEVKPLRKSRQILPGESIDAYIIFRVPARRVDSYEVHYNCSSGMIMWAVGDPIPADISVNADGFIRYPIRLTSTLYGINTVTYTDITFYGDGTVQYANPPIGTGRGRGTWELTEVADDHNTYVTTWGGGTDTIAICSDHHSTGDVFGMWEEI